MSLFHFHRETTNQHKSARQYLHSWIAMAAIACLGVAGCGGDPGADAKKGADQGTNTKTDNSKGKDSGDVAVQPPAKKDTSAKATPSTGHAKKNAPPVKLESVDLAGYDAVIKKLEGKVVVVDFWATWCEPCVERFPHIVELSHQFPNDQVAFVSVSFDEADDKDAVVDFLNKQNAGNMTNLLTSLELGDAFDAHQIDEGIPHYRLYDREGKIQHVFAVEPNTEKKVLGAEQLDIKLREMLAPPKP